MNKLLIFGGIAAAMTITSCSSVHEIPVQEMSGEWNVVKIQDNTVTPADGQEAPYMAFDVVNSRVFGSAGCNRIFGMLYTGEKGSIDLSSLAATRMMCPDMSTEDALLTALNQVKRYGMNKEGNLVLMDQKDREMVTLVKRIDEISPASLAGEWQVTFLGDMDLSLNTAEPYTITFDSNDNTFSMTTGCNNVGGQYSGKYVDITFSNMMSTRMMCPDMQVEEAAQRLLPTVVSFGELANPGTYGFYDKDNELIMSIARMEAPAAE